MATSTLIQFLAEGEEAATSHRRQIETFIASAGITAGDWVQFDTGATDADRALKVTNDANTFGTGNPLIVGVALDTVAAGEQIRVVVSGYAEGANVAAAVAAAGVPLVVDNTAAGRAVAIAAADIAPACGVSLEAAAAGNTCDVWVFKRF
ncbi:MAG: DUF2190 family protein [candidate division WOR-3 bacterium]|jgi:hypothetical protein|nr:MAG: DUF2190 family protein [candidate division WOR-3 bacterium]